MHKKVLKIVLIILVLVILGYVVSREWRQPVKLGQGVSPELKIAFDHGDFEQVIKLANDLLKQEPNNAYALLFLSQTYAQKGSLSFQEKELGVKALDYAKQASNLIPRDSRVYIAMGYAYEIMQNYQEAIKAYDQALTLEPNNVDALVHRGHTYDISGNLDRAKADYIKAKSLDDKNPQVAENLGRLYARTNETGLAFTQFNFVANQASNLRLKAEAYYNLSTLSYFSTSTEALKKSLQYASSSVLADATYPQAFVGLGRAYLGLKDYSKAEINLNKALILYPNLSLAYQLLAELYSDTGKDLKSADSFMKQSETALKDIGIMENDRAAIVAKAAFNASAKYGSVGQTDLALKTLQVAVNKADPMTLLIIQLGLTDAPNNNFKSLVNNATFKNIQIELNSKLEKSAESTVKTVSWREIGTKVLAELSPKKALAAVQTTSCVIAGKTISYNNTVLTTTSDTSSASDVYAAKLACAGLYYTLSQNGTYLLVLTNNGKLINGGKVMTVNQIMAYLDNLIQQANAAHGLSASSLQSYSGGAYYYGCANGLGSSYIPVSATVPTNLQASCVSPGTSATLTWSSVPGATNYAVRADNYTTNNWNGNCDGGQNSGDICQNVNTNSLTFTATPGASYNWWVHSIVNGVNSSESAQMSFTCAETFEVKCSANPSTGQIPLDVTWTAEAKGGPSSNYTYSWVGSDGLSGSNSSVSKHYTTAGTKYATTTVVSGNQTLSVPCPATYRYGSSNNGGGSSSGQSGVTATDGSVSFSGVCSQSLNQCSVGNFSDLSDNDTNYLWACLGSDNTSNPNGADDVTCPLNKTTISNPTTFDCSVQLRDAPTSNKVAVNTLTVWQITGTVPAANYNRLWTVNGESISNNSDTLNKIFTTEGLKTVSVSFNYGTSTISCKNNNSTATTSVVLPGNNQEI